MKRACRRNDDGMTLIEVVVAISLLALFVLGAAKMITMVRRNVDIARQHYQAVNLARDRVERARFSTFASIELLAEPPPGSRINEYGLPSASGLFMRQTDISVVTNDLKEITVKVWLLDRKTHEFAGEPQQIQTYIAKMLSQPAP